MKIRTLSLGFFFIFLSACQREHLQDNITDIDASIKQVTIKVIGNDITFNVWSFSPDSLSRPGHLVINLIDSFYIPSNNRDVFWEVQRVVDYDAVTGSIQQVKSRSVLTGSKSRQTGHVTYGDDYFASYENFISSKELTPPPPGWGTWYGHLSITGFDDALQQNQFGSTVYDLYVERYDSSDLTEVHLGNSTLSKIYRFNDQFMFEESRPIVQREFKLYESPFVISRTEALDSYQYFGPSLFSCDSFVLRNGHRETVSMGNQNISVFKPSLVRKLTYQYNQDTSQIQRFVSLFNMNTLDHLWLYFGKKYIISNFDGDEGHYNSLNWLASSFSDSVFSVSPSGQRTLQSAQSVNNQVSRDAAGRIVKIVNRLGNLSFYREMLIEYK